MSIALRKAAQSMTPASMDDVIADDDDPDERVRQAAFLVFAAPRFHVQR